nr:ribonuclease H-like domain-containing protein [Tanacetum cinerariifolium]
MIGHTIKRCYELIGYPHGFKKIDNPIKLPCFKKNFTSNSEFKPNEKQQVLVLQSLSSFTPEQMKKLLSLINDNPGNVHDHMSDYYSGANQQLTVSSTGMFNVVDISNLKIIVGHPNGTLANIKDSKLFVGFDEEKCYFQDLKKEKTLGTGSESGGLYMFNVESDNSIGHTIKRCYELIGYPPGFKKIANPIKLPCFKKNFTSNSEFKPNEKQQVPVSQSLSSFTPEQMKKLLSLINDNPGNVHDHMVDYYSGANQHLTVSSAGMFNVVDISNLKIIVGHPNGTLANIKDSKLFVGFDEEKCYFQDLKKEKTLGTGRRATLVVKGSPTFLNSDNANSEHNENRSETQFNEQSSSEGNLSPSLSGLTNVPTHHESFEPLGNGKHDVRRSSRLSKLPAKLNDYVIDSRLKYEDVYMELPFGYNHGSSGKVCKLNKSLYGLKHTPRQWNAKLTATLREHGFIQSKFDYSLFIKKSGEVFLALLVYVDDIVITELLHEYGLLAAKPASTPIPKNTVLSHKETKHDKLLSYITEYQRLSHVRAVMRVLRYLKCAPGTGIQFLKNNEPKVTVFCDADWAKYPLTRRSIFCFCVMIGKILVSFKSKRQPTISRSSVEAEYRCMAASTCEVIWIFNVLSDLKITGLFPVDMFYNSSFAIQIANNPVFHEKTKHFKIDVHVMREKVVAGVINNIKIHNSNQVADIFTKGLSISQHQQFYNDLGRVDMFRL